MNLLESVFFGIPRRNHVLFTLFFLIIVLLGFTSTQTTERDVSYQREFEYPEEHVYERNVKETSIFARPIYLASIFIFIFIFAAIYAFVGLVLTCKHFFVPSLEVIAEESGIADDVIGSTFMAIGLSLINVLVGFIRIFVSGDDPSPISSVTAKSIFNIYLVVGLSAVIGKGFVPLTPWPLLRDCTFYVFGLVSLALVCRDDSISWYESGFMFGIFVIYMVLMKFDSGLRTQSERLCCSANSSSDVALANEVTLLVAKTGENPTPVPDENGGEVKGQGLKLTWPEGIGARVAHVIFFPVSALVYCTLPDVSTPRGRRFYPWAFCGSILWATIFSDVVIWVAALGWSVKYGILNELGMPFVVGAVANPILISSIFLARKGRGAMIAHAGIGSVIFDIYIGNMVPALLFSLVFSRPFMVSRGGSQCLFGSLLVMFCCFILTLVCFRRNMNKGFGILVLIYFFLFISATFLLYFGIVGCSY